MKAQKSVMKKQAQALRDCLDLIGRMADAFTSDAQVPTDLDAIYDAGCAALAD